MSDQGATERLEGIVADLFSQGTYESFKECWRLYKETTYIPNLDGFYLSQDIEETYCNLAVVGDSKIVDIEVDEKGEHRNVTVSLCRAYSGIGLSSGSIPTLSRAQDSLLTVFCRVAGSGSIGHYWVAKNEVESTRLREFAKTVIEAISKG